MAGPAPPLFFKLPKRPLSLSSLSLSLSLSLKSQQRLKKNHTLTDSHSRASRDSDGLKGEYKKDSTRLGLTRGDVHGPPLLG